ncbi:MAG: response regulator [Deltaproteobacteria bacterium]|nr:response regulator [Deltaproteobacteria bacterium]
MTESVLSHKKMLIVDDEEDVLTVVGEEINQACSDCTIDKAKDYEKAAGLLKSKDYDLVILDIMGVRGFDLLQIAVTRGFKVAMVTAHALSSEALKKSHDMGAMAYLPKEKFGDLVPFLEDVLKHKYGTSWKRLLEKFGDFFDRTLEDDWKEKAGVKFWW